MFYEFEFFQPADFLTLSQELYDKENSLKSPSSAIKRTVISRIYYSTFLFVRNWLINHGYHSTKRDHTEIPDYIRINGPFSPMDNYFVSNELLRLKKLRHQADYYISRNDCLRYGEVWISDDIPSAFQAARDIIAKFQNVK